MTRRIDQPARSINPRSARRRIAGVCLVAATALTVALPARAVTSAVEDSTPAATVRTGWGDTGWSGGGWSDADRGGGGWGDSGGQPSVTVDSDPATYAESTGVALIDTVLTGGAGTGTGMVLTSSGEVLTNYHVVEGATEITVTVATTGQTYLATVLGSDQNADVALLQLDNANGLDTVTIDDDSVAVGDDVTAVGNAGGTGSLSAADGTVTALEATITTASEGSVAGETLTSLIETDADVVAGDSGGPLIDVEGEVVGIDTAASTGDQIDGYAVPIDDALQVVEQIRTGEETDTVRIGSSGYLGVELTAGLPEWGAQDSSAASGAEIAGVVDGEAAAQAGLEAGDVIMGVDGTSISSADELAAAIADHDAGDSITLSWVDTTGEQHAATVTLGASPTA